jgi:hypothetical protein
MRVGEPDGAGGEHPTSNVRRPSEADGRRSRSGIPAASSSLKAEEAGSLSYFQDQSGTDARRPLVLGVSRKSFLGKLGGEGAGADRLWPTVALTSYGRSHGVNVFRVHDVRPNFEALRMTEAILHEEAVA